MKNDILRVVAIASLLGGLPLAAPAVIGAAIAQTTPDPAPAQGPAPPPSSQPLTPDQQAVRDRVKGERETCRTEAQAKGVKGKALRQAVQDCVAKVDPVAAKRMRCVALARGQNLSGDAMRKSVHGCMVQS